jgi:uncharacterized protein (TIGR03000 family)
MYSMVLMVALTGSADVPDFGRRGGCHGCSGGCYGGCYGGCRGGCYGGCRGGCYGGCWGGCYGGGWGGCYGGCYGARAAWGGYGTGPTVVVMPDGSTAYQSGYYSPGNAAPEDMRAAAPDAGNRREATVQGAAPATLIVHLPADARLTVDGKATRSTSDRRTFVTPPLEPGMTYHYLLEAQLDRQGEKVRASQNVEVRAGRESEVFLEFPAAKAGRE